MIITLTGTSGFVGQNLSTYLKDQGNVVEDLSLRKENWVMNPNSNALIHLAGKAHDTGNTSAEKEYFDINTELTKKLFDQFLLSNTSDFIFFSSVKAAADTVDDILDENFEANPQTPYGKSKLLAEEYLLSKKLPRDKRIFIIRPCMIHGPGNKGNLNLLYQFAEKGIPWPLASFQNQRSFLSIGNLNYLIQEILKNKSLSSGIYNFADDESVSTNELISLIGTTMGKKSKMWALPPQLVETIAKIGDVLKLPLNTERLRKLTENYVVSNHKIKSALNIPKLPFTAEEGLIKTLKSFQK